MPLKRQDYGIDFKKRGLFDVSHDSVGHARHDVARRKWAAEHRDCMQIDLSQVLLADEFRFSLEDDAIRVCPTENSLAVLNHKILEANSQVQNVKLGGHQTCLSINRLWHELCDMLRHLVGTTASGHHDCSIQE
ncbi:uncharacterized protein TNCV_2134111 [Trichonephila clavipes]|nr:uncharacterized protein TNCV_2134111 [Trichonephila clavipes]